MTDWMDIKTAPKDGRAILAYWTGEITTVHWLGCADWGFWNLCVWGDGADGGDWNPDFWMPLPEKPATKPNVPGKIERRTHGPHRSFTAKDLHSSQIVTEDKK